VSDLKFHPEAFSFVWDIPPLSPEEHAAAFGKMLATWEREQTVIMCTCEGWLTCEHPWPRMFRVTRR